MNLFENVPIQSLAKPDITGYILFGNLGRLVLDVGILTLTHA